MALLWRRKNRRYNNILENPSPTNRKKIAHNPLSAIKGSSLPTSFRKRLMAGMTVEAAVALPVFLFFFLNLASLMEMMRLHGNLQYALWGTGSEAALYGCAAGGGMTSVLSPLYIRSGIISKLGSDYLDESPLENGAAGLTVMSNPLHSSEDILDVAVSYSVAPISGLIGFPSFRMSNYYYAHLWNGYEISENAVENEVVYVTENGVVYHRDRNCTHLLLSIEKVSAERVRELKNKWGRCYGPCQKCVRGQRPSTVYITGEGECYHYSAGCAGLKRTVRAVRLEEIRNRYRCCSRCG